MHIQMERSKCRKFLNLEGSKEILTKSYRVPQKVFGLADKIINRIPENKRVQKHGCLQRKKVWLNLILIYQK